MEIVPIPSRYIFGVNAYLLKTGAGCFLVDTGMARTRAQLESVLQEASCGPGDLKMVIITHGHLDHVGNAAYLRDRYGAWLAMHRGDYGMVESGDMFAGSRGGVMISLVRLLMRALGVSSYERFVPDVWLEDGQDLSLHGLDAKVIHLPGHSRGSVGVLTSDGGLFCGDLLVNNNKPARNTLIDDQAQYDASVERLKTLKVEAVYPGHGKPFRLEQLT